MSFTITYHGTSHEHPFSKAELLRGFGCQLPAKKYNSMCYLTEARLPLHFYHVLQAEDAVLIFRLRHGESTGHVLSLTPGRQTLIVERKTLCCAERTRVREWLGGLHVAACMIRSSIL